ncbi:MAG: hypothetical protein AB7S57_18955 [Acetobacteraceae bacterium]
MPSGTAGTANGSRASRPESEEARFEAWLRDFDARHVELTMRLDAVLRSLGDDPAKALEPAAA